MFELTIKVNNYRSTICDFNHVELKIQDLETKESCIVNFTDDTTTRRAPSTRRQKKLSKFDLEIQNNDCCRPGIIVLYSNIDTSLHKFETLIKEKFPFYNLCINNCADAANFALDYFTPSKSIHKGVLHSYKLMTSPCWLSTCGFFPYTSPLFIITPMDIFLKARWLSTIYSNPYKLPFLYNSKSAEQPSPQRMS